MWRSLYFLAEINRIEQKFKCYLDRDYSCEIQIYEATDKILPYARKNDTYFGVYRIHNYFPSQLQKKSRLLRIHLTLYLGNIVS